MTGVNQREMILRYMQENGSITPMEAIEHIGCTKLATRISELIDSGYEIIKEPIHNKNRWGKRVHYMKYRMGV